MPENLPPIDSWGEGKKKKKRVLSQYSSTVVQANSRVINALVGFQISLRSRVVSARIQALDCAQTDCKDVSVSVDPPVQRGSH